MNSKQAKALKTIFAVPVSGSVPWAMIESLLRSIGCDVIEGKGSSVSFHLNGTIAYFHRPHPEKEAKRYQVKAAREFLEKNGIKP
jgi:hypothetical protein